MDTYNCNKSTRRGLITVAEQQAILHPKRKPAKRNSKPAIYTGSEGREAMEKVASLRSRVAELEAENASLRRQLVAAPSSKPRRLQLA